MVNEEKIKLMTGIALDESKRYPKEIAEGGYFKGDYVRSHITFAVWNITIAYILVLILIAFYQADDLFVNITKLPYGKILGVILGIYGFILLITIWISIYYFSKKFAKNTAILRAYCNKLDLLKKFYTETGEETENDTTTGI